MKKTDVGKTISSFRKKKKMTQEELGSYLGVSTAAVSKWEMGNSYPDIELLPKIAGLFDVSIDKLLNYKVDLSDKEVMEIVKKCGELLVGNEEDIEKGVEIGKQYVKKYNSSYYLKLRIGFLYRMYSWRSSNDEIRGDMEKSSKEFFEDIEKNCSNMEITQQALYILSTIYSSEDNDERAVCVLKKINKSQYDVDFMLANIYMKKEETLNKGRQILQSELWRHIFLMDSILSCLGKSYIKDKNSFYLVKKYVNAAINVKKVFSPDKGGQLGFHIDYMFSAVMYLKMGKEEEALGMLEKWICYIEKNNLNNEREISKMWCFNMLSENKDTFKVDMYENMEKIIEGQEFDGLRKNTRFIQISKRVKNMVKSNH